MEEGNHDQEGYQHERHRSATNEQNHQLKERLCKHQDEECSSNEPRTEGGDSKFDQPK